MSSSHKSKSSWDASDGLERKELARWIHREGDGHHAHRAPPAPFPSERCGFCGAARSDAARATPEPAAQAAGELPHPELAEGATLALVLLRRSSEHAQQPAEPSSPMQVRKPPRDAAMGRSELKSGAEHSIVLELPGLRLAMLSSACDSARDTASSLSTAAALLIALYVAYPLVEQFISTWLELLVQAAVSLLLSFSTFLTCSMLAMEVRPATTPTFHYNPKPATPTADVLEANKSSLPLPLLAPERSVAAKSTRAAKTKQAKRVSALPAIRRRVLAHLKKSRPVVNFVAGESRRRADMSLRSASVRVGKAHMQAMAGARKPQDMYVVRVDCSAQSGVSEKHMNPVVMWDLTATFEEFQKLERELKKEMKTERKAKKLGRSETKVPHLSSGAVLFVQRELTDDVLAARRLRLQAFVDAVLSNEVLAGSLAMRKFCQAY